jgi:hypothetical protein
MWKQRFADVEARMAVFFQDVDVPALFREQSGNGRSGRAAPHDQHVASGSVVILLNGCSGHGFHPS